MARTCLSALTLVLLLSANAFSQSNNATLGGTVSDASNALIPGVTIAATNTGTGIVTTVISNETGSYQFAALQPGAYRVSAELLGFQTNTYNNVVLGISQQVRLNFSLQVRTQAQTVEVSVAADTLLSTTSASVGNVLPDYKVRDLPMANRNVLDLVDITAGTRGSSFAGQAGGMTMTTRDGIPVNHGRYDTGVFSTTYMTPDLVDEVRVIVSPVDAETGRGSGQVQMSTRSGTNEFHGALFWSNRNAVWDSNTFSNNFNGVDKNYQNRNQYGGRLGGPIVRNKTFFFFLFEGQRSVSKSQVVTTVLSDTARQGIYRYFPGVQSANANALTPTVDQLGNPVRPSGATGDLRSFNVFAYDPLRPGPDPSGQMGRIIGAMPRANDFNSGDGLNTAGHRWLRTVSGTANLQGTSNFLNRDQYNARIDHQFNISHKMSLGATRERNWADSGLADWPNGFNGRDVARPQVYTASFVSTLSPTLLNEFRFGLRRGTLDSVLAYDVPGARGDESRKWLGFAPGPGGPISAGGTPYVIEGSIIGSNYLINDWNGGIGNVNPLWTYGDTLSWTQGKHAFKGGAEFRYGNGNAWNSDEIVPNVHLGYPGAPSGPGTGRNRDYYCTNCGIPVTGFNTANMPGIQNTDISRAQQVLTDLAGSAANISQAFSLRPDPFNIQWADYPNYYKKFRDFHQNEFAAFFKDDWKIHNRLTLNLGARWEWYGVPYEASGMMARPVGGTSGAFGLSGSSFDDWYKPGERGQLTTFEFVGKHSPNPSEQLHQDDWNNFAPAIGLSWQLPWFQRSTVLRAGYGLSYQGRFAGGGALGVDIGVGLAPSLNHFSRHPTTTPADLDLRNIVLPIKERHPDGAIPIVPVTERSQSLSVYDTNMVAPYVQNFNLELQRELARDLTLEVRYIGSKGSKLQGGININSRIIEENGFLEAYRITRAGGNAQMFDRMLTGLNIPGAGRVNGTTLTDSAALRRFSSTRTFLANNNPVGLADFLNSSPSLTGVTGGIARNGDFPENFFVANPQFNNVTINGNPNNSTYHSLQTGITKRLSYGFTNQTTYTWSRTIGTTGNIDPRNRSLNKALSNNHRTHDIRSNGVWELPFGPGRLLLGNASSWVSRLVEGWQLGGVFSWNSGAPLTLTAGSNPFGGTSQFPNLVGEFPKSSGKRTITDQPGVVTYFEGFGQITDPDRSAVTTVNSLQNYFSNRAITDAQGNLLLVNPGVGEIGNLGQAWIEGPGQIDFDANLSKRIRVGENKSVQLRIDAINVMNHPNWGNPTVNINSTQFGRISLPNSGNRQFTFGARLDF